MASRDSQVFMIEPAAGAVGGGHAMGFKAYNLARMARVGLPVPNAFVLGTGFCRDFLEHGHRLPPDMSELLAAQVRHLEAASGLMFGSERRPLLVSVRSG